MSVEVFGGSEREAHRSVALLSPACFLFIFKFYINKCLITDYISGQSIDLFC